MANNKGPRFADFDGRNGTVQMLRFYPTRNRQRLEFDCPFCQRFVDGDQRSIRASGKRCECGALLYTKYGVGMAFHWYDASRHAA